MMEKEGNKSSEKNEEIKTGISLISNERKDYWLKKLAWFVMENMGKQEIFYNIFADSFSSDDIYAFDLLTDELFPQKKRSK